MTTKKNLTIRKRRSSAPEENLRRIAALRKKQAEINEQIKTRQDELLAQLEEREMEKITYKDEEDGVTITGTVVRSSTVTTDDEALKKKVGAQVWKKITTLTLDKKKLEVAIQAGDVADVDVAAASTITQRTPYVKVTVK